MSASQTAKLVHDVTELHNYLATIKVDDSVVELIERPRRSTKRTIRKACIQVIENPKASVREKLRAIGILERLTRDRDFRLLDRKNNRKKSKPSQNETKVPLDEIIGQVAGDGTEQHNVSDDGKTS